MYNMNDYIGKTFGNWTILEYIGKKNGRHYIKCKCNKCNNTKVIKFDRVIRQDKIKCMGCKPVKIVRHYQKHGLTNTRLYAIWNHMKGRCENPKTVHYKYYGGRGIKICDEWKNDFMTFYNWAISNGYTDELTIDRINVNGNYEPSNCRWVTMEQQVINRNRFRNCSYYTGVSRVCYYEAQIIIHKKYIRLGHFKTQKEALEARNKYIIDNGLDYPIQEYKGELGNTDN